MENLKLFSYQGNRITFDFSKGNQMINATQMAKPFGKKPNDFLRLPSIKSYCKKLESKSNTGKSRITQKGNSASAGTWMHRLLAVRFAQWLNQDFAIWVDARIYELLTTGKTELQPTDDKTILANAMLIAQKVIAEKDMLIEEMTPKVEYHDTVLIAANTFPITLIAKELKTTAVKLNQFLKEQKVQFKKAKTWLLCEQYINKGYTGTYTQTFKGKDEKVYTVHQTNWTELGKKFIIELYNSKHPSQTLFPNLLIPTK